MNIPDKIYINKAALKDTKGRYLTQSLFLEIGYNSDTAIFTLKDDHYEYEGKVFYSLKKLYLEEEDVTEYNFANKYFLGWDHWKKITENLVIFKHIRKWREELELKIRARAMKNTINSAMSGNYQAARFLLNGEWKPSKNGRPTKKEVERERRILSGIDEVAAEADLLRLVK